MGGFEVKQGHVSWGRRARVWGGLEASPRCDLGGQGRVWVCSAEQLARWLRGVGSGGM